MSYECIYCDFTAPTNTRLKRHLATQKHATNRNIKVVCMGLPGVGIVPTACESALHATKPSRLSDNANIVFFNRLRYFG